MYLRWPVETGDHSVFRPALVRKLSVQREFGSSLRLSETNTNQQQPQMTHHTPETSRVCWQINTLTPLYPEGPVRCSRKTRPPARRERAPRSESCGQRKSRTPPSEESAVSLPPSAHEGALHTETKFPSAVEKLQLSYISWLTMFESATFLFLFLGVFLLLMLQSRLRQSQILLLFLIYRQQWRSSVSFAHGCIKEQQCVCDLPSLWWVCVGVWVSFVYDTSSLGGKSTCVTFDMPNFSGPRLQKTQMHMFRPKKTVGYCNNK